MTAYELEIEVSQLNSNKASMKNDIPAKMLIKSKDIVSSYLSNIYNNSKNDYNQARFQRGDLGIYLPSIFWKWKLLKMCKLMGENRLALKFSLEIRTERRNF